MKKTLKERFEQRSLLFLVAMMISMNMFIFVLLFLINQFLLGHFESAVPLSLIVIVLFTVPYILTMRKKSLSKLSDVIKDDLFLLGFSLAFIPVGLIVIFLLLFDIIAT